MYKAVFPVRPPYSWVVFAGQVLLAGRGSHYSGLIKAPFTRFFPHFLSLFTFQLWGERKLCDSSSILLLLPFNSISSDLWLNLSASSSFLRFCKFPGEEAVRKVAALSPNSIEFTRFYAKLLVSMRIWSFLCEFDVLATTNFGGVVDCGAAGGSVRLLSPQRMLVSPQPLDLRVQNRFDVRSKIITRIWMLEITIHFLEIIRIEFLFGIWFSVFVFVIPFIKFRREIRVPAKKDRRRTARDEGREGEASAWRLRVANRHCSMLCAGWMSSSCCGGTDLVVVVLAALIPWLRLWRWRQCEGTMLQRPRKS